MTIEEIMKKYKDEWLLIEYTELDKNLQVIEGAVIAHSTSKEKIYETQLKERTKDLAIIYAGELPNVAVMF